MLQSTGVDPFLTVRETVEMYGGYYPHPRPTDEVIDVVGLTEKIDDARPSALAAGSSAGSTSRSRWRATRSCSSSTSRPPASIRARGATRGRSCKNLVTLGKTVWLTTHFMDEAQYLADRVAVIANGRDRGRGTAVVARGPRPDADDGPVPAVARRAGAAELGQVPDGERVARDAHRRPDAASLHEVTGWALEHGVELEVFEVAQPSLEDVYLELTGAEEGTS